jgi:ribosomal protein S6--L-glutamate ligase
VPIKKLIILTRRPELPSVVLLAEAAQRLQVTPVVLSIDELAVERAAKEGRSVSIRTRDGALVAPPALVLPRMGSIADEYSLTVLRAFEAAGFTEVNRAEALMHVRNKAAALIELASASFPVLPFAMLRSPSDVRAVAKKLGGFPVMVKFIRGAQGLGVMKAGDAATAEAIVGAFNALGFDVYLERFCSPRKSRDARILVVRGKVLAAMERVRGRYDYRANVHKGARPKSYDPPEKERTLAVRVARHFKLGLCAVDFLRTADGDFILEVNASPGFTGISEATGRDIAEESLRRLLGLRKRAKRR